MRGDFSVIFGIRSVLFPLFRNIISLFISVYTTSRVMVAREGDANPSRAQIR